MRVVEATGAPIAWEVVDNIVDKLTPEAVASLKKHRVALKGEFQVGACGRGSASGARRVRGSTLAPSTRFPSLPFPSRRTLLSVARVSARPVRRRRPEVAPLDQHRAPQDAGRLRERRPLLPHPRCVARLSNPASFLPLSFPPLALASRVSVPFPFFFSSPLHSCSGVKTRHEGVDIVIIRENTEGEYSGMEHEVAPGITESLKIMSRAATQRIAKYAFEYAYLNNRAKVTAVHKANIMKRADGLFLESCQEVAKQYPKIEYEEIIVDNCMMQLVSKPQQFDVMVTPNFYGSLVSNVVAGLIGGPGLAPGANVGDNGAIFEQGCRHVGLDIAGQDSVNPTAILFSSVMMLRHLKLPVFAMSIEDALFAALEAGHKTKDIGGSLTTSAFVDKVVSNIKLQQAAAAAAAGVLPKKK